MQPIIVRTNNSENFELVAGNRRFNACKTIGLRKIPCYIVELDDKKAFEVSIIENVQRNTLNPIDEGLAFRKYVQEYGWGGVSELAEKLSKSISYICKRIRLTELPRDIIDLISKSEVSASIGEELLPIENKYIQSKLAEIIQSQQISSRSVRKLVKEAGNMNPDEDLLCRFADNSQYEKMCRIFDKIIIHIKLLLKKLANLIETVEDKWIIYDILMQHKHKLHEQIDLLIKQKRKYKKYFHSLCENY